MITCDEFAKISSDKYGEDITNSKEYNIYNYYEELDTMYEISDYTEDAMELYYRIPGLSDFFNPEDDIYIYAHRNYYNRDTHELGFSVIKGKDLPEFISNYKGAFFDDCPIIIDFASNSGFFYQLEHPFANDLCTFRDYTKVKRKYLYRKLINILNTYNIERGKKIQEEKLN